MTSKIEWTDETWNPVIGCSKDSAGCENCYAERMAGRLAAMNQRPYQDVVNAPSLDYGPKCTWNGETAFVESALDKPLRWRKPRKIFPCSMGDMFHGSVTTEWLDRVWDVMAACRHHMFQVLTKRPERMLRYVEARNNAAGHGILPNVWLGTSVENQDAFNARISHLLNCPAAVRFVSFEPLLGPVKIPQICDLSACNDHKHPFKCDNPDCSRRTLHLVIVGGESGPGARPMHPDWVRTLRDQCKAASVPFMFKQWGEWLPDSQYHEQAKYHEQAQHSWPNGSTSWWVGKKAAGRTLDGVEHMEFPFNI